MTQFRKAIAIVALLFVFTLTSACSTVAPNRDTAYRSDNQTTISSNPSQKGDTSQGQDFGNWVVKTSQGLIQDAYVRGDDKLGVVISPQVKPNEVRPLAKSLVQGFSRNAPNRDLTVLVYAPDRKLILTALYDNQSNQIRYQ